MSIEFPNQIDRRIAVAEQLLLVGRNWYTHLDDEFAYMLCYQIPVKENPGKIELFLLRPEIEVYDTRFAEFAQGCLGKPISFDTDEPEYGSEEHPLDEPDRIKLLQVMELKQAITSTPDTACSKVTLVTNDGQTINIHGSEQDAEIIAGVCIFFNIYDKNILSHILQTGVKIVHSADPRRKDMLCCLSSQDKPQSLNKVPPTDTNPGTIINIT